VLADFSVHANSASEIKWELRAACNLIHFPCGIETLPGVIENGFDSIVIPARHFCDVVQKAINAVQILVAMRPERVNLVRLNLIIGAK